MKRLTGVLTVLVLFWACEPIPTGFEVPVPSYAIFDAVHEVGGASGNEHFFWLPPMVSNPSPGGVFDGTLAPVVTIDDLTQATQIAEFTMIAGPGSETIQVSTLDEHYHVNWHTTDFGLDANHTYRVGASVDGVVLGYADVNVVSSGKELKNVNTGEYIPLKDGRTLPIKFRIEEGAIPLPPIQGWQTLPTPAPAGVLRAIWGASSDDIYAVGDPGVIIHFDGSDWNEVYSQTPVPGWSLFGIWGTPGGGIYAVGGGPTWANGVILENAGAGWQMMPTPADAPSFAEVWGSAPANIYAVGGNGPGASYIARFDGSNWRSVAHPLGARLEGVWGSSPDDIWVVGRAGRILHWDGLGWTLKPSPTGRDLWAVWGIPDGKVWAAGSTEILRYDKESDRWVVEVSWGSPTSSKLWALWGSSDSDVYAVGDCRTAYHYDGSQWANNPRGSCNWLGGIWGTSDGDVWAVGNVILKGVRY